MDLQISVFLLFVLFTAGHSLSCYKCISGTGSCPGQTATPCLSGYTHCASSTTVTQVGATTSKLISKDCVPACQSGSLNFGIVRTTISCCNTELCNRQDAPDPVQNGKKCYFCDGQSCSKTLNCLETEDFCIKATESSGGQTAEVKGCASKSICDATTSVRNVASISCCEGNLCNAAQSVSQSFLFLCVSLVSYFLLH